MGLGLERQDKTVGSWQSNTPFGFVASLLHGTYKKCNKLYSEGIQECQGIINSNPKFDFLRIYGDRLENPVQVKILCGASTTK